MGWYLLMVTVHYFNQRPLWNDEQCVFNSVESFSAQQLFSQPLSNIQQFPKTYLYLIQQVSAPFNWHLLALRFLPFACMVIAFMLWMRIAYRYFQDSWKMVLFVACWVASTPLIYYAAELKQYSMDTMSAAFFAWFLIHQPQWPTTKVRRWLMALPLLGLFSYPALLFLPLPVINAWVLAGRGWRLPKEIGGYLGMALVVVAVVYWVDIRVSVSDLPSYWADYFISTASIGSFFQTLGESLNNFVGRWFAINPKWIRGASRFFIGFGFLYLICTFFVQWRKDRFIFRRLAPIAFFIFVELFILSVLQKYTFSVVRVVLFFCPFLLMATIDGMGWLKEKNRIAGIAMASIFLIYLMVVAYGISVEVLGGDLGAEKTLFSRFN